MSVAGQDTRSPVQPGNSLEDAASTWFAQKPKKISRMANKKLD